MQTLTILYNSTRVGELLYDRHLDRMQLRYESTWPEQSEAFPISLALPLEGEFYQDEPVRNFLRGLLPDNREILKSWAKRFHVSENNPFSLMQNVGEDCAGALQFVRPERLDHKLSGELDQLVELNTSDLKRHFEDLKLHARAIPTFDFEGRFSLAGAQSKTALFSKDGQWFQPEGRIPTTHILKPQIEDYDEHTLNEHTCLELASYCGLKTAESTIIKIAEQPVISVKRYDRHKLDDGRIIRIHQEDCCQAAGIPPERKYQSDGGPSPAQICNMLRTNSRPEG